MSQPSTSPPPAPPATPVSARPACPPFSPAVMTRQLAVDAVLRLGALAAILVAAGVLTSHELGLGAAGYVLAGLVLVGSMALSMVSASVGRELPRITALIDQDPVEAEVQLGAALRRRPLQRSLRLILYQRLALLRHRQQRFAEAAAICESLVARSRGLPADVRANLLLMLVEAHLRGGQLGPAWQGLQDLHRMPLGLTESLHLLMLQTRYEVAAGYDHLALAHLDRKMPLIELMAAPQCAAIHALLADAARRAGGLVLADWLARRAALLGGPQAAGESSRPSV